MAGFHRLTGMCHEGLPCAGVNIFERVKKVKIAEICIFLVVFYVVLRRRRFFSFKVSKISILF
ncbi:hypothetical protein YI89_001821 [Salmonella enterica subsp. enterica]|nr:hypothetical protein [Salmonella enterica subsp. enterica serovar Geraldton]EBG5296650.1 hypothetical protein [Salmonella enterica subsp. enterica]EDN7241807.1 hypothetical protein [Salmonella enterica subsp. enterica serovar Thompson]EEE2003259.1 hypothetical protein [Salmonella enterica subsp. enterica serovar Kotte]EEF3250636.1 hypothetical protein [Salmonella enterica subsp. enterica serovar Abony]EEJ7563739.1 hypothetical protein [Salmonella enterica subsp. salamae]EGI6310565.1 hypoth